MSTWIIPPGWGSEVGVVYNADYGAKVIANWEMALFSACCEARVVGHSNGTDSKCVFCDRTIYSSASPHYSTQLYWGGSTWDQVEGKMADWIEYWFGIAKEDIKVQINGKDPKENML